MVALVTWILIALPAGPDAVPPADPEIRAAINLYDTLEFERVVPILRRALDRAEILDVDRRTALAYLGRAYAALRKPRLAVDVFCRRCICNLNHLLYFVFSYFELYFSQVNDKSAVINASSSSLW